ncbi:methyl-accepting chemotaxis protein [Lacrimispora saccharolytica]|uniref:Methyl-accepting chemotaxis sensory transducer n=1 Tax=Lacrimispora saccharolytica (strain ATCC 35040 / DSM 2544 / NRCC 2533 / WM1) TaxID=610130 RepID=D9R1P4_LACSW|nr:methyl-accepting chemotaxis protein [Lacrimispora saccharolytica]ADL06567.1 methyl-accepting chemotaxis sensory transducer [[Clostridium] saccharolyticum WM1]QRV19356.1 HAMP domain-containing protein [Lacrimispora saccharolytica]
MKRNNRGIKKELVTFTMACIISIVFVLSAGSIYLTYDTTRKSLAKSLKETSELVSEKITQQLKEYSIIAESIALYMKGNLQKDGNINIFLRISCSQYGLNNIDIISADGLSIVNGKSYKQENTYVQAKKGTPFLSDPMIHKDSVSYEYAYPYDDLVIILEFPYSVFETMIADTKLGDTGSTYIINRDGTKVAYEDFSQVLSRQNNTEAAKSNQAVYGEIAKLEAAMTRGETGFGFYQWNGEKKFGSYTPVKGTNGWSVNVTASESEFMSGVMTSMLNAVILGIVSLILAVFAMLRITNRITRPMGRVVDAIDRLSAGDLGVELSLERRDEIGRIGEKVNEMAGTYRNIIYDISRFLQEISYGNLSVRSSCRYPGEFNGIRSSMEMIAARLNDTMITIRSSSEEVNYRAGQVSDVSQALASGAAVQAETVEELNASIANVSGKAVNNADHVKKAWDYVNQSASMVKSGNRHMESLHATMKEISLFSEKISGITKMIEDIAFQTNILALNAAVEAARAGDAGRGFAVVAEEVRNLSAKSAEAAKQTAQLIGRTGKAVSEGKQQTDETAEVLKKISGKSALLEQVIQEIQAASQEQARTMEQIREGLYQVSAVVQANAATAQESSSSSEELAAQAGILKQEVSKFIINGNQRTD